MLYKKKSTDSSPRLIQKRLTAEMCYSYKIIILEDDSCNID